MSRIFLISLCLMPTMALAHPGHGTEAAFLSGVSHPIGGLDHVLAMLAVGLWAGISGGRAFWALPLAFVAAMIAGGALGATGVGFPAVEPMILASIIVIGALAALALRPGLAVSVALVALFGLAHGHAHGTEGPAGDLALYAAGFALATMALHLAGMALVRLAPLMVARASAAVTALGGAALAFG
ncbi:HupE/UreJ family protein [Szabonella alba]|uniref:HupE/UreJ family protein n=1 Tax=Szabonella alba TaxID=2804194 RepID=A0A8K0VC07_9RHOB|nr:HupE/UreJ family protein [Szabonella alba]MBL4917105.1 HupE/UreJ family protein [Szabonella alba]